MSKDNTSEEKSLPASPKKLKDLRKKGRIARSTDMVAGAGTVAAFLFLTSATGAFTRSFQETVQTIMGVMELPFRLAAAEAAKTIVFNLGYYIAALIFIVVSVVFAANLAINRGFLFSLDAIKFDFNKLNPVEGFQRIFSMRSAVELAKNIIKIGLLLVFSIYALIGGLKAAFSIPYCGIKCLGPVAHQLALPIIITAAVIFLLSGIIDVAIQNWLFMRDQRMTKSEAKRERKEEEGSPEIRQTQRRLRRRFLQLEKYTDADATIFIEGISAAVGLRFVRTETPLPVIVCKAKGERVIDLINFAHQQKIPIYFDDEFASNLSSKAEIGATLTQVFFEAFIKALKATGQL
jgi:type III secretion protein U